MNYLAHLIIAFSTQAMFLLSLNLVAGYGGRASLAHAAFAACGGYGAAILASSSGGYVAGAALGAILGSLLAWQLGVIVLRLRRDQFVLATLAFQIVVFSVLQNADSLTGGVYGLPGLPVPTVAGTALGPPQLALVSIAMLVAVAWLCERVVSSPFGRLLRAVRDDEQAAAALGHKYQAVLRTAFVLAAFLAALPGALSVATTRFVDPAMFQPMASLMMLSLVVIGGAGSRWGPWLAAAVMTVVPEGLMLMGVSGPRAASIHQALLGALLVVVVMRFPGGLDEFRHRLVRGSSS